MKKTAMPKESLTKAKILKGIKLIINKNTVLPILESVYLSDNFISATDLENHVTIPFEMKGLKNDVCINADKFISVMEMLNTPKFSFEGYKKVEGDSNPIGILEISESKKKIKLVSDNPMSFVVSPIAGNKADDFNEIGFFSEENLKAFKNALLFASTDDLRPALTGIYVKSEIVSTDAHRLYWEKIKPLFDKSEMIIPPKTVRLMLHFGGNWQVFGGRLDINEKKKTKQYQQVAILNEDGVLIQFRAIDASYPNYKVVIPTDEPKTVLISDATLWRKELKNALKFANVSTHMGVITLNGKVSLRSNDVDFSMEYEREFEPSEVEVKGDNIQIAFNMHLLDSVLSILPNDQPFKMNMWSDTKATIINDHILLMPLMLNK